MRLDLTTHALDAHSLAALAARHPSGAAMLTARPWNKIVDPSLDSLDMPDSEEERLKLKQYAAYYAVGACCAAHRRAHAACPRPAECPRR